MAATGERFSGLALLPAEVTGWLLVRRGGLLASDLAPALAVALLFTAAPLAQVVRGKRRPVAWPALDGVMAALAAVWLLATFAGPYPGAAVPGLGALVLAAAV